MIGLTRMYLVVRRIENWKGSINCIVRVFFTLLATEVQLVKKNVFMIAFIDLPTQTIHPFGWRRCRYEQSF